MSNLPTGSDNDLNAPWNEQDYGDKECPDCLGDGYLYYSPIEDGDYYKEECDNCDGTGTIPMTKEDYLDWLESKKEDFREK